MAIIGISGKIGSGKSYTSRYIQNRLGYERKSFGYNVKKIVSFLTGVSMKTILSRKAKANFLPEWNMTLGEMFQKVGTDCMRDNLHKDSWVISMFAKYTPDQNWVIDDVRFQNEADYIKKLGGIIIRLEGDPNDIRKDDTRDPNHESETSLDNYDKFDIIWDNDHNPNIEDMMCIVKKLI